MITEYRIRTFELGAMATLNGRITDYILKGINGYGALNFEQKLELCGLWIFQNHQEAHDILIRVIESANGLAPLLALDLTQQLNSPHKIIDLIKKDLQALLCPIIIECWNEIKKTADYASEINALCPRVASDAAR